MNEKLKKELFQKFNTGQTKQNLNGNISFFNISATFLIFSPVVL